MNMWRIHSQKLERLSYCMKASSTDYPSRMRSSRSSGSLNLGKISSKLTKRLNRRQNHRGTQARAFLTSHRWRLSMKLQQLLVPSQLDHQSRRSLCLRIASTTAAWKTQRAHTRQCKNLYTRITKCTIHPLIRNQTRAWIKVSRWARRSRLNTPSSTSFRRCRKIIKRALC